MNRRDIFKGAAGGVAAGVLAGQSPEVQRGATAHPPPSYRGPANGPVDGLINPIPDPFHAAKMALVRHATRERELLDEQLDRKRESLGRMKSVSEAYKRWMYEQYRKESRAINKRWETFVDGVWKSSF